MHNGGRGLRDGWRIDFVASSGPAVGVGERDSHKSNNSAMVGTRRDKGDAGMQLDDVTEREKEEHSHDTAVRLAYA